LADGGKIARIREAIDGLVARKRYSNGLANVLAERSQAATALKQPV
jgi:hypothetical protein